MFVSSLSAALGLLHRVLVGSLAFANLEAGDGRLDRLFLGVTLSFVLAVLLLPERIPVPHDGNGGEVVNRRRGGNRPL